MISTKARPETSPDQRIADVSPSGFPVHGNLRRLFLLWKERRVLARVSAAGLVFGIVLAFLIPKEYQSSARLMPPDNQSSAGMMMATLAATTGSGLGALAGDVLGLKNSGDLFVGVLGSRTVQGRVVQRFDLRKVYGTALEEDARIRLAANTGLTADRKSGIITVTVTDRDPRRAQAVAQAYIEELNRLVVELSTSAAHRERVFLEERLKAVKADLDQSSLEFSQFSSKNETIDIKEQGKAMVGAAATLAGELITAESEMKGLEAIYTASNPRVRSVQARITELRRQLNDMGGKAPDTGADSQAAANTLYPSIRQLPILGVTYADLYRRTKIQEEVYDALTQQYEMAKVQEAKETPSVKALDVANVPERKSFPPRMLIVFLCVCSAFVAGALWILARASWEQVDPCDPGKAFVREVFHSVNQNMPWAPSNGSRLQAVTHRAWVRLARKKESIS